MGKWILKFCLLSGWGVRICWKLIGEGTTPLSHAVLVQLPSGSSQAVVTPCVCSEALHAQKEGRQKVDVIFEIILCDEISNISQQGELLSG